MNLHEYQGKNLLKLNNIEIQKGIIAYSSDEALKAAQIIKSETKTNKWIIKAQIHSGGRGKSGGIKIASSLKEVETISSKILGMKIITPQTGKEGKIVNTILINEDVYYSGLNSLKEYYISIILDRNNNENTIVYSDQGGIDIEDIHKNTPYKIKKENINPLLGIQNFQIRKIFNNLGIDIYLFEKFKKFIKNFYNCYIKYNALLFEINPLLKTSDNKFIAVDAKVNIDDNAIFRHQDLNYDVKEGNDIEIYANSFGLKFIQLKGNVACIVNGAGLAMATMDMIKISGGNPANFLDIGGTADDKRVENAFHVILKDKNVKIILINIFGGIVRCERVALGILNAEKNIKNNLIPPIVLRLQGTNFILAQEIIKSSKLSIYPVNNLKDAARQINKLI